MMTSTMRCLMKSGMYTHRVENRIKRLMASRGYSEEKCRGIMANQASEDDYRSFATRVLDNNGGIEDIRKQIASFLGKED